MNESLLTNEYGHSKHVHFDLIDRYESAVNEAPFHHLLLSRQAIVDASGTLVGCELFVNETLRPPDTGYESGPDATVQIWNVLYEFSVSSAPARQKAFFRATPSLLESSGINLLPTEALVLELDIIGAPDARLINRCRTLRDRGFSLALANYSGIDERSRALLSLLDCVAIDLHECNESSCRELAGSLSNLPIKLLAQGIDSANQMAFCQELGFAYYQGTHIALPETIDQQHLPLSRAAVLRLLRLVDNNADISIIESALKKEAVLLYHLLCLSLSFRDESQQAPCTLRSALVSIGAPSLARWLRLHLARLETNPDTPSHTDLSIQAAALRGRMLELLVQKLEPNNVRLSDAAYLAGCLSMMPKEPTRQLKLEAEVSHLTVKRAGQFGHLLDILDLFDQSDSITCDQQIQKVSKGRWGYPLLSECFAGALSWLTST